MNSRDITVYLDERWYNALSKHLNDETLEEHLENILDEMCNQLPQAEYERISQEIWQEEQLNKAAAEAGRRFSLTQITENGKSRCVLLERGEIMFQTALRLRRYLQGELQSPAQFYGDGVPITQEEMERYTAEMLRDSPRVVGLYDIDLDAGKVYSLDSDKGWQGYQIKDVSTAAYFATKRQSDDWIAKRSRFNQRLIEKKLPNAARPIFIRAEGSLPTELICFEGEISQIDHQLNFYIPVYFNPDQVFGLNVETEENSDYLNLYANYDMERGCVCNTLEVYLVRGDGSELECEYRLTSEEQEILRSKMDGYCMEQMGISLKAAREQYLTEEQSSISTSEAISQVEQLRRETHQTVDEKCDALIRKAVLGHDGTNERLIPLGNDLSFLKGEKPSAVILPSKGITVPVKTWRQAAIAILQDCTTDPSCRERLMEMRHKISGNFRILLSDTPDGMDAPLEICEGLYMEGKFDTGALLHALTDKILPYTSYDYQSVVLQLRDQKQEHTTVPQEQMEMETPQQLGPTLQM